jgi:hypothetical protein
VSHESQQKETRHKNGCKRDEFRLDVWFALGRPQEPHGYGGCCRSFQCLFDYRFHKSEMLDVA